MKRFLTILMTVLLLCTSILTARIVFAEDEDVDTSFETQEEVENDENQEKEQDESSAENSGESVQSVVPEEGYAYGILLDNGDLVFFRSYEVYDYGTEAITATDIFDNEYTGIIINRDFEGSGKSLRVSTYYEVKKVYVAENQTIKPGSINGMCTSTGIKEFYSKGFDTSDAESMEYLFMNCRNLETVDLSHFNTGNVTNMAYMFFGCESLTSLDLGSLNTSKVTNMVCMFQDCSSLTSISGLNNFNTGNVMKMSQMFSGCSKLKTLDLSHFNTSKVTSMTCMFEDCSSLTSLNVSSFNTGNVTSMSSMFAGCSSLSSLDVGHFNTEKVTDMSNMFEGCSSLTSLNVSSFKTGNVSNLFAMFRSCSMLKTIDVSNFDTRNVEDIGSLFNGCSSLESVDVSNFDTSKVTYMGSMFCDCSSLKSINLSGFDTRLVTYFSHMFHGCSSLTSLDLSSFKTDSIEGMIYMFYGCTSLKSLDISNFNTSGLVEDDFTRMNWAFDYCDSLERIKLGRNFTVWIDSSYLPVGTWYHGDLAKTQFELYKEYPSNAAIWAGWWTRNVSEIKIKISYHSNYGNDQAIERTTTDSYIYVEDDSLFVRNDFEIESWNTRADGNGTEYSFGDRISNYGSDLLELALYAQWKEKPKARYSQKWEYVGKMSLGAGGNYGVSVLDMELSLGKAILSANSGGKISLSVETEGDKKTLKVSDEYEEGKQRKVSLGPKAEAEAVEFSAIKASVDGAVSKGVTHSNELKIEDYDPDNLSQQVQLGKFFLGSCARNSGNLLLSMLFNKIGSVKTADEVKFQAQYSGGIKLFSMDSSIIKGSLLTGEQKGIASYSVKIDDGDYRKITQKTETTSGSELDLFSFKLGYLNPSLSGSAVGTETIVSKKTEVKSDNGVFTSVKQTESKKDKASALGPYLQKINKTEIEYTGKNAENVVRQVSALQEFANKKSLLYMIDGFSYLIKSPKELNSITATYVNSAEEVRGFGLKLPFKLALGIEFDLGVEVEGKYTLSYQTEKGIANKDEIKTTDKTDYGEYAKSHTDYLDLVRLFVDAIKSLKLENMLKTIDSDIMQELIDDYIRLKKALDYVASGYNIHIVKLSNDSNGNGAIVPSVSYEITTYSPYSVNGWNNEDPSIKESKAYSVGDPYYIFMTDENDEVVYEFDDKPLELTLKYDEQMLESAGISFEESGNLYIYKYDEDLCGYVCIGGTRDIENKSITAVITEAGEYVIAADFLAPAISDFNVSDYSALPTINVCFDEASLFNEISVKLDGVQLINSANWKDYYIGLTKTISFVPEKELEDGKHIVEVFAEDSAGNAMEYPLYYSFVVDTTSPSISNSIIRYDDSHIRIGIWSDETDMDYISALLSGSEKEIKLDRAEDYYCGLLSYENLPEYIVIKAYDIHANVNEFNISLTQNERVSDAINDLWYSLSDGTYFVYSGKAIKPQIKVYEGADILKEGKDYTIKYSNNTKVGTATITVTGKGNYTKKDTISFDIHPKPLEDEDVIVSGLNPVKYNGKIQKVKPVIKYNGKTLKAGMDYILEYNDSFGGNEYKEVGTYSIVVKAKEGGNFSGLLNLEYSVIPKTQTLISKVSLTKPKDIQYTGDPINEESFDIVLKDKNNKERSGGILLKDTDYSLSLSEDTTNIGKVDVTITGLGLYSGTRVTSFKITGIPMSKVKVNGLNSFVYDGTGKTLDYLTVTYQKDKNSEIKTLTPGEDFELYYDNNVKAGTASVTLTGKGLYTGTVKKTYKITPYDMAADEAQKLSVYYADSVSFSKTGVRPEVSVYFGNTLLTEGTDYTISYKNNTAVNDRSNAKKIPSFTIKGKGNFKGSLINNEFSITQRSLTDNVSMTAVDKVYSLKKNSWKSAPVLTDNGKKLVSGTDYDKNSIVYTYVSETSINNGTDTRQAGDTVEPTDIIPAGTRIRVTVTGIKNFRDELSCIYRITKADISKASITVQPKEYTGEPVTLTKDDITVKLNKQVVDPSNYEIDETTYKNNINKGKASVILRGVNDLGSSKTVNYSIGAKLFQWWFNLWQ